MVDTVRSEADILTSMPLEAEGISGQDVRDLVVSAKVDETQILVNMQKVVRAADVATAEAEIIAANAAAVSAGGGEIILQPSNSSYIVSSAEGPSIDDRVTFNGNGQTIEWTNNTAGTTNCGLRAKPGCAIENVYINATGPLQTGANLIFRGVDKFDREQATAVSRVRLFGNDARLNRGLYMLADRSGVDDSSTFNYVNWVHCDDIHMIKCGDALAMESINDRSVNFINGNNFFGLYMDSCTRGIYAKSEFNDGAVGGNKIIGVQFQTVTGANSERFAYFSRADNNTITHCEVWDWEAFNQNVDDIGVEFDTGASFNTVEVRVGNLTNPDAFFNGVNKRSNVTSLVNRDHVGRAFFVANDSTPDIYNGEYFFTNNTNPTTITDFDRGFMGKRIRVKINDNNTTIDFSSNSNLQGNGGVDWSPSSGDFLEAWYDSNIWYCTVIAAS